ISSAEITQTTEITHCASNLKEIDQSISIDIHQLIQSMQDIGEKGLFTADAAIALQDAFKQLLQDQDQFQFSNCNELPPAQAQSTNSLGANAAIDWGTNEFSKNQFEIIQTTPGSGNGSSDSFVFKTNFGHDTIANLKPGMDFVQ